MDLLHKLYNESKIMNRECRHLLLKGNGISPIYYAVQIENHPELANMKIDKSPQEKGGCAKLEIHMKNGLNPDTDEKVAEFISTGGCLTQVIKLDERKFNIYTTVQHEEVAEAEDTCKYHAQMRVQDRYKGIIALGENVIGRASSFVTEDEIVDVVYCREITIAVYDPLYPDKYYLACKLKVAPDGTLTSRAYGKIVDYNKFGIANKT